MNKIRLISSLTIAVVLGFMSSCNKDKDDAAPSGTGNTDFQVYVTNNNNQLIDSAVVSLYASLSDRDAGTNVINSGSTGIQGFVFFSELSSTKYYVSVSATDNALTKSGKGDTGIPIKEKDQSAITVIVK